MPSISNIAAQALQRRILDGEFPAGAMLPSQRDLSEQLSISRSSLREALSTLEALGLVRAQPGKGVFVTGGNGPARAPKGTASMTPRALLEFRLALEPAWTRLAALRLDAAGRQRLEAIQKGMDDALKACDLVMAADWDLQFHLCLAELSGNPGFLAIAQQFREQIGHSLRLPFSNAAGLWEPADEHHAILAALRAGDADAAESAMRIHLRAAARRTHIDFSES
ncbi:FadR/GntR family transcriptional regulator [Stutzerimonas azotifigens]|uniref:FadR/GntR family transcriptional regulator n=1 Tax=Stutzerimonas azotifigens TaxID=291995 RepID=UPI0003FD0C42|nr:FadR/GntR family transcriptional regulator [Stutzerimonas azotifigens]